jgi:hypothetical protein
MKILLISIIIALGFGAYTVTAGCGSTYSEGERTGVIVKFSRKGIIFKSWEGQINLGSASVDQGGVVIPASFEFSVTDGIVAQKLLDAQRNGKRVTLKYNQWLVKPPSLDTSYVVTGIE